MIFQYICAGWSYLTAPIHELGHFVFAWLTLNPAIPGGWNIVYVTRDTLIVALGGNIGAVLFPLLLVWKLRQKRWIYPLIIWHVVAWSVTFPNQHDFNGDPFKPVAMAVWFLCSVLALVLCGMIWAQEASNERTEREEPSGSATVSGRQDHSNLRSFQGSSRPYASAARYR